MQSWKKSDLGAATVFIAFWAYWAWRNKNWPAPPGVQVFLLLAALSVYLFSAFKGYPRRSDTTPNFAYVVFGCMEEI